MNEFRFEKYQSRSRIKLPRPVLYVGVAIILLAFFSVKFFQRAGEAETPSPIPVPAQPEETAVVDPRPAPVTWDDNGEGILSLDGEGARLQPPRRISGELPVIPPPLLQESGLAKPRVYVRVDKEGLVTECKLISSSGSTEVDRLVLDALAGFTFHPAITAGQPVEYSSVITVPLTAAPPE